MYCIYSSFVIYTKLECQTSIAHVFDVEFRYPIHIKWRGWGNTFLSSSNKQLFHFFEIYYTLRFLSSYYE